MVAARLSGAGGYWSVSARFPRRLALARSFATPGAPIVDFIANRRLATGGKEHVILGDAATLRLAADPTPALRDFFAADQRKMHTTWINERQLTAAGGHMPAHVQVLGRALTEDRLGVLYNALQDRLPRLKHAGKEGQRANLSNLAEPVCTLMLATAAEIPGYDAKVDLRYILMADEFLFQTWLAKPGNTETIHRVLKNEGLPHEEIPIVWTSELAPKQPAVKKGTPVPESPPPMAPSHGVAQWTKAQVLHWVNSLPFDDEEDRQEAVAILGRQKINGKALLSYTVDSLTADGMPRGSALTILDALKRM